MYMHDQEAKQAAKKQETGATWAPGCLTASACAHNVYMRAYKYTRTNLLGSYGLGQLLVGLLPFRPLFRQLRLHAPDLVLHASPGASQCAGLCGAVRPSSSHVHGKPLLRNHSAISLITILQTRSKVCASASQTAAMACNALAHG